MDKWTNVPVETLKEGDETFLSGQVLRVEPHTKECGWVTLYFPPAEAHEGEVVERYLPGTLMKRRRTVLDITPEELAQAEWGIGVLVDDAKEFSKLSADRQELYIDNAKRYCEALRHLAAELEKDD